MKKIILLFFFTALLLSVFSQPVADPKETFNNGLFFYESGDYKEALYNFLQLFQMDTGNESINYKIAMCYFNLAGEELKSINYLKRAVRNISDTYNEYSFKNTTAPLHTLFYLGKAYRLNGQIDKALETIEQFTASPYYVEYTASIVDREITTCKRAQILMDKPVNIKYLNLGNVINDEADNFNAVMSYDGNTIVYITKLKLYDAIFYSTRNQGSWSTPVNISSQIGSDGNMKPTSLSADGTQLFVVVNINGLNDIFVSNLTDGSWSVAQPLGANINTKADETHGCISADGNQLFFSSNAKGSGKLDIFVSTKDASGQWGKPVNLGKMINTPDNETTPFISQNGNILFFSSEGHYNIGEYDIFYSMKDANGKWQQPVNLGYPINTTTNNLFFAPTGNSNTALVAKKSSDGFGALDIYQIDLLFDPFGKFTASEK